MVVECSKVNYVTETNMQLVDFDLIVNEIEMDRFYCNLPTNIKKLTSEGEKETENPQKKLKVEGQVKNPSQVEAWKLKDSESWNNVFRGRTKDGPKLRNGSLPCLKYHVKGICYEDCPYHKSHRKLEGEDFSKMGAFIERLRRA